MKNVFAAMTALTIALSAGAQAACARSAAPVKREENAPAAQTPAAEAQRDWWNILLLGGDSRSISAYERTDSMIIFSVNIRDIFILAGVALKFDSESIGQYRIPADGTFESGMKYGFWSIRPDFMKNKELLHEFIYGSVQ